MFRTRDSTKIEDFLRSIFGNQAYMLFTVDKSLAFLCKSLSHLASDDLSKRMLSLSVDIDQEKLKPGQRDDTLFAFVQKMVLEMVN